MRMRFLLLPLLGCSMPLFAQPAGGGSLDALIRPVQGEARRASSSNEDLNRNGDADGIAPGETLVLMDEDGPGIITHFWNTIAAYDPFSGRSVVLRVYYDNNEKPSVEAPLGDFFGVGLGAQKNLASIPVNVSSYGRSRACYWRMPFRQHVKVTVSNDSPTYKVDSFYYYLDWLKMPELPEDTTYFHARYHQEYPAQPGNYTLLNTTGRGQYVGTVYSCLQVETGWFGEGDDFFYIDGAEAPQLRGTGTEDYFNDSWGFREFSAPYYGVSQYEGVITGDRVSAYRWHIEDPVPFQQSLRVDMEHRGSIYNDRGTIANFDLASFEERPDWVSSVAFWYQYPPAVSETPLPAVEKRIPPYRVIKFSDLTFRADPPILVMPADPFLVYVPSAEQASIELDFEIPEDGRYRIDAVLLHSIMSGIFQASLDGKKIGTPLDLVIVNHDPAWERLDTHDLKAGKHTLRFEKANQLSPNVRELAPKFNMFGIAYLTLLRLDDLEGYQQVMNRLLNPVK